MLGTLNFAIFFYLSHKSMFDVFQIFHDLSLDSTVSCKKTVGLEEDVFVPYDGSSRRVQFPQNNAWHSCLTISIFFLWIMSVRVLDKHSILNLADSFINERILL